jgi:organic radical activating enzyme
MKGKLKYNCIESLKKADAPIIIVVTVDEAEAVANACRDNGITVEAFCDSEKRKSEELFCGLEVIHTPTLPQRYPNARFIIASQHIPDCVEQLTGLGYSEFYSILELLENYDVNKYQYRVSQSYMTSRLAVCKKTHEFYFDADKIYMRSLDVMITTKCSLKCTYCSNLMQYYVDPKHTEHEEILSALNILNENVDHISEFRVIGGEPLMNKDWADIVNGINKKNAESKIDIYTNATISPTDEQLESFQGKNVNFIITDYAELSRNIDTMIAKLTKYNISFNREPANNWIDCSSIKHHKRPIPQLEEVFKQCCVKYVYTLLHGKIYRCPFIANAANLNAIPDNPANYVELLSNPNNINQKIRRLVNETKFFPACDFCDGRPYDPSSKLGYDGKGMIAGGEQVSSPLPYKVYN